ncbi:predicted protein [Postia placenta Mad-698-R]|uniref:Uncharacterized protein n=1 Tax=Postia placenta MAD-698-R-SB12 TaxID=670580 RepID=A0A1X6N273_9APHY|nr:hypothetical protein POSPLADRAFT_1046109 [Postia placenta MAD-698-R-SB12]EED82461.1 predicted protein [Postia placenta Mad-698-R]OSX62694.1 hypothetical protein POSPLADRAFT_1046109 [Postia placenta MAD-698-R-SB12]
MGFSSTGTRSYWMSQHGYEVGAIPDSSSCDIYMTDRNMAQSDCENEIAVMARIFNGEESYALTEIRSKSLGVRTMHTHGMIIGLDVVDRSLLLTPAPFASRLHVVVIFSKTLSAQFVGIMILDGIMISGKRTPAQRQTKNPSDGERRRTEGWVKRLLWGSHKEETGGGFM